MKVALGFAKSTALYVFLSLPVCVWGFGVAFAVVKSAVEEPTSFADWFLVAGFWALPALVVIVVFNAVLVFVEYRLFKRDRSVNVIGSVVGGLQYAVVKPFKGLLALGVNKRVNDLTGIPRFMATALSNFYFCWAIALIGYLAAGFIAVSMS